MNDVPPGPYTNLQASKPYPRLGNVFVYQTPATPGTTRCSGAGTALHQWPELQPLLRIWAEPRRFPVASRATQPTPFAPIGYNRALCPRRRHVLTINGVYELPFGRGKRWATQMGRLSNAVLADGKLPRSIISIPAAPGFVVPLATLGKRLQYAPNLIATRIWTSPA